MLYISWRQNPVQNIFKSIKILQLQRGERYFFEKEVIISSNSLTVARSPGTVPVVCFAGQGASSITKSGGIFIGVIKNPTSSFSPYKANVTICFALCLISYQLPCICLVYDRIFICKNTFNNLP
jgi:hypothetical protein